MNRALCRVAAAALLVTSAHVAAAPSNDQRNRQLSEIVFQNYPPGALAAGEEGPVFFVVELDKDAHPVTCQVTHGSGYPSLDKETCHLIVQHAVFNSARGADGRLTKRIAEGVVNWTLPGHTPVPINMSVLATTPKAEKQVCKKTVRVGTLASIERTCMTASEWARRADEQKQPYDELQGRKGATNESMCHGGISCNDSTVGTFVDAHGKPQ